MQYISVVYFILYIATPNIYIQNKVIYLHIVVTFILVTMVTSSTMVTSCHFGFLINKILHWSDSEAIHKCSLFIIWYRL